MRQWKLCSYTRLNSRLFTYLKWISGSNRTRYIIFFSEKWPKVDSYVCKWLPNFLEPVTPVVEGKRAICLHYSIKNKLPVTRISWDLGATELREVSFGICEVERLDFKFGIDLRKPTPWAESANNHLSNEALSATLKFVSWYANFFSDGETVQSKLSIHHGGKILLMTPMKGFVF